jgi:hypothetical protein
VAAAAGDCKFGGIPSVWSVCGANGQRGCMGSVVSMRTVALLTGQAVSLQRVLSGGVAL